MDDIATVTDLRGREGEERVAELLGIAQIHRPPEEQLGRGREIAAEYARSETLDLWGYEDGGILGIAGVEPDEGELFVHDFAVHPEARKRGVGRALLDFLRRQYPGRRIYGYTLAEATGFYKACGFDVREDGVIADGRTRYAFEIARQPPGPPASDDRS